MEITTEPPVINLHKQVSNEDEAEDTIMHIILMTWGNCLNRVDVTITLPNGIKRTFTHHRGDSLIDFAKKLLEETKKHL